jgi:ketosteroid isomerase-like protein
MSRENVEVVRRDYEAVASRDVETVLSLYDTDVEWDFTRHPLSNLIGEGIHRGHDGLRAFFRELSGVWESIDWELEDVIDAGNHVVTVVKQRGRGRMSGAEVEGYAIGVWTIDKGKVTRAVWF